MLQYHKIATKQYNNSIQHKNNNTKQYNTSQYNTMAMPTTQCNAVKYNRMLTIQYNTMTDNTSNTIQFLSCLVFGKLVSNLVS